MNLLKDAVKSLSNLHFPGESPNVFLFSTPRSGSTWLMELIWSQSGFKYCNEPLNLRNPQVRKNLGISEWKDLYREGNNLHLEEYFRGITSGKIRFLNPNPFRQYYRPITNRIVFKILHAGEDRINWFRDTFNGRIVYLIRHPIPVALSRKVLPRLETFLTSDFRKNFTADQLRFAEELFQTGDFLEKAVLDWSMQNAVALRQVKRDWAVVTYEQLTLEPKTIIEQLKFKIQLDAPDRIEAGQTKPSAVKGLSDVETRSFLESGSSDRSWLIEKWKEKIDSMTETRLMKVLRIFELDIYRPGSFLPSDEFWARH